MANTVLYQNPNSVLFEENSSPEDVAGMLVVTGTSTRVVHAGDATFNDIVFDGSNFAITNGKLSAGTVTTITTYKELSPHSTDFITTGLSMPVSVMLGFASSNDGLGLMKYIYAGDDVISNSGNNCPSIMAGYGGNDSLIGGILTDTAAYVGKRSEYLVTMNSDGSFSVADTIAGRDGTDTLTNIERLQFSDQNAGFDIGGNAVQVPTVFQPPPVVTTGTLQTTIAAPASNASVAGSGLDVMNLGSQSSSSFKMTSNGDGSFIMVSAGSVNHIAGVLQIQFADKTMNVAPANSLNAGVALLYQAALNRAPEAAGLAYWDRVVTTQPEATVLNTAAGAAKGIISIASGFTGSAEFISKYGPNLSATQFVTQLYSNVLDRQPDSGGLGYWVSQITAGVSREQILAGFAESAEGITNATVGFVGQSGAHAAWLLLT